MKIRFYKNIMGNWEIEREGGYEVVLRENRRENSKILNITSKDPNNLSG